jgi:uncharacterized membrane protein
LCLKEGTMMKLLVAGAIVAVVGLGAGAITHAATEPGKEESFAGASAAVHDCPAGTRTDAYAAGSRVYATARTASGDWVQVRDIAAPGSAVWLRSADVALDQDIAELPEGECTVGDVVTTTSTFSPGATTTTEVRSTTTITDTTTSSAPESTTSPPPDTTIPPTDTTSPPPDTTLPTTTGPPDTTPPSIQQPSALPSEIWENDTQSLSCPPASPRQSVVSAAVTDDVGVTSVTASWTIGGSPVTETMHLSGGRYSTDFGSFDTPTITTEYPYREVISITIRASDAAGNESKSTLQVTVNSVWECFG